ncbi:hypothetical protein BDF14DRAFT_1806411 [Spinellus fusiger]|nr:hypothetical protein BDF14DRAFT_1806411 [Spinellus fusiger]
MTQQHSISERQKESCLSIEAGTDTQVQLDPVPIEAGHLYPKLAGPNWTCYITSESTVLGRTRTPADKLLGAQEDIYIGLGSSKAISRRHADIKYNPRKKQWEIRVCGRNGIKVGHRVKKRGDAPSVLCTG